MSNSHFEVLRSELSKRADKIRQYILDQIDSAQLQPDALSDAVKDYVNYGGKMLRPGVLLFACGAVGGDEDIALPAAAAVELFHTWTLVHDDIIDQDAKRRGNDSLHVRYYKKSLANPGLNLSDSQARHFGQSLSILAGDAQHGLSISLLTELFFTKRVNPEVVLVVIKELDAAVLNRLVSGETLDVVYSKQSIDALDAEAIKTMLWGKTGALYEFAGRAGALIGLNTPDKNHPLVQAIATFTSKCGLAFQLLDDILGIVGDEKKLGKPVGSDIREGKKTLVIHHALQKANPEQRNKILSILGNSSASVDDHQEVISLTKKTGGIAFTQELARNYLNEALNALNQVPDSKYKQLLNSWAEFMIQRDF